MMASRTARSRSPPDRQLSLFKALRSASNLYVGYNIIDGGGTSGAVSSDNTGLGSLVTMDGSGLTLLYNWLKNAGTDMVDVGGGGTITYEYNLLQNGGMVTATCRLSSARNWHLHRQC